MILSHIMKNWCGPNQIGGSCRRLKSRFKILSFVYRQMLLDYKQLYCKTGNMLIFLDWEIEAKDRTVMLQ